MPTTLRSYAKINLGLAIGPIRDDGFHDLLTLYQTIALHDLVTVTARHLPAAATHSRLSLSSNNPRVPCDARNTAWRMVAGALERMDLKAEVHIHIEKRLPIQGGMGAGSANAAAALIGLERELQQTMPRHECLTLAAQVGSDVPLFLIGGSVLGTGRGEIVVSAQDLPPTPCVVAIPEIGISTPRAFQAWDALQQSLPSDAKPDTLKRLRRAYEPLRLGPEDGTVPGDWLNSEINNDFETVIFDQHATLLAIKQILVGLHAEERAFYAALSGSGSALFGLYSTPEAAEAAQVRLGQANVKSLLTETLPRPRYWAKMIAETPDRP